mmetsp:Transcript_31212/g.81882  ORF Transcript_31212/g.81882 Transcript_31212/m.81882 type:complete len:87 (-) Transcript_31212:721-981(-)
MEDTDAKWTPPSPSPFSTASTHARTYAHTCIKTDACLHSCSLTQTRFSRHPPYLIWIKTVFLTFADTTIPVWRFHEVKGGEEREIR